MRKKLIIILNFFFITVSIYLLVEDYYRVGKFQWVDQNAIDDNEELFFNPICVITIILGIISIFYQLRWRTPGPQNYITKFLLKFAATPLRIIYGVFSLLLGFTFFILVAGNVGNLGVMGLKEFGSLLLLLIIFSGYSFLGFLMLCQIHLEKNTEKL